MEHIAIKPELMQQDGIHPNIKAQPLIVTFMKQHLDSLITLSTNQ
jgi:acyl-CoA thioesterase-1